MVQAQTRRADIAHSVAGITGAVVALALGAAAGAFALGALTGCETQAQYATCELDSEVLKKGLCTGSNAKDHDTSSCVVKRHPHCDHSICLSYYGQQAVCTQPCTGDGDPVCGAAGRCWTFSDADVLTKSTTQRYCVPKATMKLAGHL